MGGIIMKRRYIKGVVAALTLVLLFLTLSACGKDVIKIGFIGSLTSKNSQLSIDARNAIELGIDQVNRSGGIQGRLLELVVKDDGASEETALLRHNEFAQEDIELVLGHMTSNMANAAMKSQSEHLMFLSPSMGASSLTGIDDYFLRTAPLTDNQAWTFFEIVTKLSTKKAVIVYDLMNAEYTENMALYAKEINEERYKIDLTLIPFDSREGEVEQTVSEILEIEDVELVLMISQAVDTALISQKLKSENSEIQLASVSWSMTEDLILNGGRAVEGMYFIGIYTSENASDEKLAFEKSFYEKYQYQPSFICFMAYDAFYVMVKGIENADDINAVSVKESILSLGKIQGLEETFEIDAYGDNNRGYLLHQLINGEFVPLYN